ncbi:MAG: VWA domain-containing protein [Piscinibacter sp.]|nr:VWA domain-containing protein [Piscinibacter sp.]
MRRTRGPLFPLFRHPVAPLTRTGRVVVLVLLAVWAFCLTVAWSPAFADDAQALPAEGPYFQVASSDPSADRLPLKSTRVDVRIAGVIADVTVTQQYRNEGQRPIEARYVFPGSTRAAVHAMQVRLGGRTIVAQIDEKQRARIRHETAKREGKTSALLEQHRPNVFQMNVANILPGDEVAVELRYTELIAPTEGRYAFVFPTVVGPRYHVPAAQGGASHFPATPVLPEGEASPSAFDLAVHFASPLPVSELRSSTHGIEVQGEGTPVAEVALNDGGPRNDRDFVLEYRLAGERTATGLMLFKGEGDDGAPGENFFLALVEPPKAIASAQINPREYVFVVDISGSMHGHPLNTAKVLLRNLIGGLRPSDTFNVMLFSGSNQMLNATPVPATRANIERAIATIDQARGGGSTEIVPALRRIAALPKNADVSRSVIVVTDGYVTVENQVFELVRRNLGNSNVFAFGIGSSVNRHLIEGIARAGQGEPFIVTRPELAAAQAERLRRMIDAPVLTALHARFDGLDVYDLEPAALDALPDVLGGRPVLIQGKWRGEPQGQLVLEGQAANGSYSEVVPVSLPDADAGALRQLWARSRIQQLSDQEALEGGSGQREAITALGLRYSLLTQYTSFIAVDHVVRTSEPAVPVDQPLPLPQGVSANAVGAAVPSTPEPGAWLSLLVVFGLVGAALFRRGNW